MAAIAASTIVALLTAPADAQDTRIEQLESGSVVVVFPDRTRVVLDEDAVTRLSQRFETTLLGAGAMLRGGTSGGTDGGGNGTTTGVIAGLESDTSQYGIEEALALESQLNSIVADTVADGGIAGGGTNDGASLASADGNSGNGGDSVFNPVVDLTDPEAVGDEDIPASGAQ
ncbi:hypothetical protein DRB17_05285 [Ferruginivarius sediminum]|uniref:Uncharacterized protein n=1 Tax=Ferruginivarius sediminum TaxID=2661937 RepID=A0A369TCZ2_9PROT|nr:hypothetical protein DRB17_05285 [Ferruginivarius sediminum]